MTPYLSLYLQSSIIRFVTLSNQHEYKDTYKGSEYWYIIFNGEKRIQTPITFSMVDIALVSKWWFKVVKQNTSSIFMRGHLKKQILKSIHHSRNHSIYSSKNIQTLKWTLNNKYLCNDSELDYKEQLLQLLPQLQTINLLFDGTVNNQVLRALKSIQKHRQDIVINIEFDTNGEYYDGDSKMEWPFYLDGFTPNTVSLSIIKLNPDEFSYYSDKFINKINDLQPESLNMYINRDDEYQHYNYGKIFNHLKMVKHVNIGEDDVDLGHLKYLFSCSTRLESLKLDLLSTALVGTGSNFVDWIEFCENIADTPTLKRLHLCEYSGAKKVVVPTILQGKKSLFQMAFESIWSRKEIHSSNIEYLALEHMPNLMSSNMWNTLCQVNCHNITKLLLTNGTVPKDMVPSLSRLIPPTQRLQFYQSMETS
ncbi:hypothetical protein DFA_05077 [Cavenderia fasciculata]|uniref:Uncharacterized protein n=1 Tax=Cavenderia fasciculata TaxID=261658 RepID=F4PN94_CACFS|nr:uncharacterized protein DFA_05077 [Cavenderia fasciculata]EGG22947.1 hypothetical protein DFA_05077 [Cavenderia fasciculata]|eukprot:XP_004360798.1 hypothetical protein DFA_05077 [Cavenderia fasciculata]